MPTLTQTVRTVSQPRVLLIEDDPNISLIVMRWLTGKGMEVVHTEEAGQAETLCGEDRWDIIISDIELSGFNGLDLVEISKGRFPSRPLVMMTCHGTSAYAIRALKLGVDDFILKPLQRDAFLDAVDNQLRRTESGRRDILAIGAHPDDVEIGVGGLLLKHRAQGDRVHILTLTGGEQGGIVPRRRREAEEAAKLMDASLCFGDLPDTAVSEGYETIQLIRSFLEQVQPDVIYTHTVNDAHQDHRAVHRATMVAARNVPNVYCYQSPSTTIEFRPNQFADIGAWLPGKLSLIERYESQTQKVPYLQGDLIVSTARYWGRYAGYCNAEPLEVIREAR